MSLAEKDRALITKDVILTIDGRNASLSEEIYVYVGDRNIDINFTIIDAKYKFGENGGNILSQSTDIICSRVLLKKETGDENGETDFVTPAQIVQNGVVTFKIDNEVCDALEEIGRHELQIQLYSIKYNDENIAYISGRVTVPSVKFEVLEPIINEGIDLGSIDDLIESGEL